MRRVVVGLCALTCALIWAPTASAACPTGTPSWDGGFDTKNLSQYYQLLSRYPSRVTYSTAVAECNASARFELRNGDLWTDSTERIQTRGINRSPANPMFHEGEDQYFRFGVYVDPSTAISGPISNPWRTLVAWPSTQDGALSPFHFFLQRTNGTGAVSTSQAGTDSIAFGGDKGNSGAYDTDYWSVGVTKGQWYDFIAHIKFSASASVGFVELWMDSPYGGYGYFGPQKFKNGSTRMYMRSLTSGGTANQRVGLYRNKNFATTDVVYYDNVRMGPTLASVGGE
jgi:hypothetical protein